MSRAGCSDGLGLSDGSGNGSGLGLGYGFGFGDGEGYGHGFGYGGGDSYGSGQVIGAVGKHSVICYPAWGYLRVGCQVHTLSWWRDNWTECAAEHGIEARAKAVDALLNALFLEAIG